MDGDRGGVLGRRVLRVEDRRLLTAGGTYVDDLTVPELDGAARVTFVRSPIAHALVTGIDASAAHAEPGVVAVLTSQDMPVPDGPQELAGEGDSGTADEATAEPLLAADRARYGGEPVAMVLTEGRYQGEDAAELVSVDYEPLPAVVGLDEALADRSVLFPAKGSNLIASGGDDDTGDALFDGCDVVVDGTFVNQRVAPMPLEVRGAAAAWAGDRLTVWVSTQNSQICRAQISGQLGLAPAAVRVIVPDVGGGFGAKIGCDRE